MIHGYRIMDWLNIKLMVILVVGLSLRCCCLCQALSMSKFRETSIINYGFERVTQNFKRLSTKSLNKWFDYQLKWLWYFWLQTNCILKQHENFLCFATHGDAHGGNPVNPSATNNKRGKEIDEVMPKPSHFSESWWECFRNPWPLSARLFWYQKIYNYTYIRFISVIQNFSLVSQRFLMWARLIIVS